MLATYDQTIVPYGSGTIQMVPWDSGYVPAYERNSQAETGLALSSRNARYMRPEAKEAPDNPTYTSSRRLATPAETGIGSLIDIYA